MTWQAIAAIVLSAIDGILDLAGLISKNLSEDDVESLRRGISEGMSIRGTLIREQVASEWNIVRSGDSE